MSTHFTTSDIERFIAVSQEIENEPEVKSLKKLLSVQNKIEIFDGIESFELKALVYDVAFKKHQFKEYIIKEEENSLDIFFILKGECHVFKDKKHIGTLLEGDTFGEIGVIFNIQRSADVVAASKEVVLLRFKIDQDNLEFNARALAILYKNLALAINNKLQELNIAFIKKR